MLGGVKKCACETTTWPRSRENGLASLAVGYHRFTVFHGLRRPGDGLDLELEVRLSEARCQRGDHVDRSPRSSRRRWSSSSARAARPSQQWPGRPRGRSSPAVPLLAAMLTRSTDACVNEAGRWRDFEVEPRGLRVPLFGPKLPPQLRTEERAKAFWSSAHPALWTVSKEALGIGPFSGAATMNRDALRSSPLLDGKLRQRLYPLVSRIETVNMETHTSVRLAVGAAHSMAQLDESGEAVKAVGDVEAWLTGASDTAELKAKGFELDALVVAEMRRSPTLRPDLLVLRSAANALIAAGFASLAETSFREDFPQYSQPHQVAVADWADQSAEWACVGGGNHAAKDLPSGPVRASLFGNACLFVLESMLSAVGA